MIKLNSDKVNKDKLIESIKIKLASKSLGTDSIYAIRSCNSIDSVTPDQFVNGTVIYSRDSNNMYLVSNGGFIVIDKI